MPHDLESNSVAHTFDEKKNFRLPKDLQCDSMNPGPVDNTGDLTPGVLTAGMPVSSHYLTADPDGDAQSASLAVYSGDLEFDGDIICVIVLPQNLAASDPVLGHPFTAYGQGAIELFVPAQDTFDWAGNKLRFEFRTRPFVDHIRIVTKGERIPRMPAVDQQMEILHDNMAPPELALEAINRLVQLNVAPPLILPTCHDDGAGNCDEMVREETHAFTERVTQDLNDAIGTLRRVKMGDWDGTTVVNPHGDGGVRAAADEASVFLESVLSVYRGLAMQVKDIDPRGTAPLRLNAQGRQIESPFLPFPSRGRHDGPIEAVSTCNISAGVTKSDFWSTSGPEIGPSDEGSSSGGTWGAPYGSFAPAAEACIVTKEVFGIKALLRNRIVAVYQEPWDVRTSPIIGYKKVWYIEFVPAELIKSIIYRWGPSNVLMEVRQRVVHMPDLRKFWAIFPAAGVR